MISQKATILCVYDILKRFSDEDHIISADTIRSKLKLIYDVDMERRAVYRNISSLREYGIEIEGYNDNREGYYLVDRDFEVYEIRLLCDAVAASGHIDQEKTNKIIKKLFETQSVYEGQSLRKTIYIKEKKENYNRQLFYSIDVLNVAINQGRVVYAEYTDPLFADDDKRVVLFSAYATFWAKSNYYVLVKEVDSTELSHIRVDHLKNLALTEQPCDIIYGGINVSSYIDREVLNAGEGIVTVNLKCKRDMWSDALDYFRECMLLADSINYITIKVKDTPHRVKDFAMANILSCEVTKPESIRKDIAAMIEAGYKKYIR